VPGLRHMMAFIRRGVQSIASDQVERQAQPMKMPPAAPIYS